MRYERAISSSSPNDQTSYIMVNSTRFIFSRVSAQRTSPLISRVLIDPVSSGLNGTAVNCMDIITSNTASIFIIIRDLINGTLRKIYAILRLYKIPCSMDSTLYTCSY